MFLVREPCPLIFLVHKFELTVTTGPSIFVNLTFILTPDTFYEKLCFACGLKLDVDEAFTYPF